MQDTEQETEQDSEEYSAHPGYDETPHQRRVREKQEAGGGEWLPWRRSPSDKERRKAAKKREEQERKEEKKKKAEEKKKGTESMDARGEK